MPTRRQTILALANAAVAGGAVSTMGAFAGSTTSPSADFRIIADARRELKLVPGRADEAYVITDEDGYVVEIVLDGTGVMGDGISKRAETQFLDLVEIEHEPPGPPFDTITFEFDVETGHETEEEAIAEALSIIASDARIPGTGTENYLEATDDGDAHDDLLEPNNRVPFGIAIDLLGPELTDLPHPDDLSITLIIRATPIPDPPGGGRSQ